MNITHYPPVDKEISSYINSLLKTTSLEEIENFDYEVFENSYRKWIEQSSKHTINLNGFQHSTFIFGTAAGIDSFIMRHHNKRIRASNDDFILTKILCKNNNINFLPLESDNLAPNDAIIISHPFSGNGSVMPNFIDTLEQAENNKIPVLLDCAYFGISSGLTYPTQYNCISDMLFSSSKNFGTTHLRLGIRFTRKQIDDGLSFGHIAAGIYNKQGACITAKILQKFSHDWFINKWLPISAEVSRELNLIDTHCITLKSSKKPMPEFTRGSYIRICISDELSARN